MNELNQLPLTKLTNYYQREVIAIDEWYNVYHVTFVNGSTTFLSKRVYALLVAMNETLEHLNRSRAKFNQYQTDTYKELVETVWLRFKGYHTVYLKLQTHSLAKVKEWLSDNIESTYGAWLILFGGYH